MKKETEIERTDSKERRCRNMIGIMKRFKIIIIMKRKMMESQKESFASQLYHFNFSFYNLYFHIRFPYYYYYFFASKNEEGEK